MKIVTGVDILDIKDFQSSLRSGGVNFIKRVFSEKEYKNNKISHLAGVFAAKEAVIKALSLPAGSWLLIEIANKENGRPFAVFKNKLKNKIKTSNFDLSISHSETSAIAIFVALF